MKLLITNIYLIVKERDTEKKEPTPFTTSKLQQYASNEMRVTPKETMKICQTLYEAGLITYMRTDSTKYKKEFLNTVKPYITKSWGEDYINENIDLSEGKGTDKKTPKKQQKNQTKMIRKMIIMPKKYTKYLSNEY